MSRRRWYTECRRRRSEWSAVCESLPLPAIAARVLELAPAKPDGYAGAEVH